MATRSAPEPAICDLRCMLCGELTGQLVDAAFVHNPNCPLRLERTQARMPSLYSPATL